MSTLVPNATPPARWSASVFFVLVFLSGLCTSSRPSSGLAKIAAYFPVRHLILALFASFQRRQASSPWAWHDLGVMAIWGVGGAIVALRRWQWSPRRG